LKEGMDKLMMDYVGNRHHILLALGANIYSVLEYPQTFFAIFKKRFKKDQHLSCIETR